MKTTVNTFNKGLITDISELSLDSQALRYARNVDFISENTENQLILQKRASYVMAESEDSGLILCSGDILGVKVLNDVAYILSYNPSTGEGEIGSYPSPDWIAVSDRDRVVDMVDKYSPFYNFYNGAGDIFDDENYNSAFTTTEFKFNAVTEIDMELQTSYDGSTNVVFSSTNNPVRIINSRFSVSEDNTEATLIKRKAKKSTNTYSEEYFYQTELIPRAVVLPDLEFKGVTDGGKLLGGGYRYYFKYVTADGSETDVVEESRLVSVHNGASIYSATGVVGTKETSKATCFKMTFLDRSYYGIKVYFTHYSGEAAVSGASYSINKIYTIGEGDNINKSFGECTIIHTGYEGSSAVEESDINISYSGISNAETITAINNRLLVGNTNYKTPNNDDLAKLAASIVVEEGTFNVYCNGSIAYDWEKEYTYANPKFSHDNVGYWKGETYEIGMRFITNDGVSPVYPCHGLDNADGFGHSSMNNALVGTIFNGFINGQNSEGVYRTKDTMTGFIKHYYSTGSTYQATKLVMNIQPVIQEASSLGVKGFFFVRRRRKKNKIAQGLLLPMATVSTQTQYVDEKELCTSGAIVGFGLDPYFRPFEDSNDYAGNDLKYVPAPLCMMPFGNETIVQEDGPGSTDFVIQAPIKDLEDFKNFAFYSPDTDCAPALTASMFSGNTHGVELTGHGIAGSMTFTDEFQPALHDDIPYAVSINTSSSGQKYYGSALGYKASCTFISTGQNSTSSGSMCGLSDRNITIGWRGNSVKELTEKGDSVFFTVLNESENYGGKYNYRISHDTSHTTSRPGCSVKYGQYIGISFDNSPWSSWINKLNMPILDKNSSGQNRVGFMSMKNIGTYDDSPNGSYSLPDSYGLYANIYSSESTEMYTSSEWEAVYDISDSSSAYVSISKRYDVIRLAQDIDVGDASYDLDVYGGDCILGTQWKQAWFPAGVAGVPNANDIYAYRSDARKALGLLKYGMVIPVFGQANHNFHLRIPEEVESEMELFGSKRSFHPVRGVETIRGTRQEETSLYNFGYSAFDETANPHFRLNSDAQYFKYTYPNRVYASDTDLENQFANGYTIFKGLSYKDYNTELGPLVSLNRLGNTAILVFEDGISAVNVDEKQAISESGSIYIEGSKALSRSTVISKKTGAYSKEAVIETEGYVYGYNPDKNTVWRTNGTAYEDLSMLKVQSLLRKMKERIEEAGYTLRVKLSYDNVKGDIYISFYGMYNDRVQVEYSSSIVFNESLNIWVCETNDIRDDLFMIGDRKFMTVHRDAQFYEYYQPQVYTHDYGIASTDPSYLEKTYFNSFPAAARTSFSNNDRADGVDGKFHSEIEIVANGDNAMSNKHFNNIWIFSNDTIPSRVIYNSDNTKNFDQLVNPYTNIRAKLNSRVIGYNADNGFIYTLISPYSFTKPFNGTPLSPGDPITIMFDNGNIFHTYITATEIGTGITDGMVTRIRVAHTPIANGWSLGYGDLYYGHMNNLRVSNSSREGNFTRLQIKGRYQDVPYYITSQGNEAVSKYAQYKNLRLMGKTATIRFIYEGGDALDMSSIATQYLDYFY